MRLPAAMGGAVDFARVNVTLTTGSAEQIIPLCEASGGVRPHAPK
jgi:hypothetical protein